ncbi:hypothetical protein PHAVU_003G209000 [Phaseolus vulgaris]|uniref:DUF7950 domain-containing protein n=1 Tax=Phaseolus vulgaris TaxID=3885 RepID=V7CBD7_PHAVU|nr:hypothetical protein PHAVU_003G209000g [Phaseolus vulgaris]ESW27517.1 hypothetical protein PHAVU_003G209000g [Phaseolus vulgaris]
MDGRGGCCIARYVPAASHVSTMDKIMLRFRPIAPKPASDASSSESSDALLKTRTSKRKCVSDINCNTKRRTRRRKNTSSPELKQKQMRKRKQPAVTLPLLPETPDRKDSPVRDLTPPIAKEAGNNYTNNSNNYLKKNVPVWLSFERRSLTRKVEPYDAMMAGCCSCVTVECVTNAWVEGEWLGSTDEERRVRLKRDTCPGLITDGYGMVTWRNEAYCEMMKGERDGAVFLVIKEGLLLPYPSFTCKVKVVQYVWGRERSSVTLPCDVWRMDSGGFVWRLDVKTALSLKLGY